MTTPLNERIPLTVEDIIRFVSHQAHKVHQAYHHANGQDRNLWIEDCPMNTCASTRTFVADLLEGP